mmetsp:Transcript_88499/g.275162  ORF Transcript_88499/g.275162 Transcript_88499/m.275162 type:complete len:232 (+) Transcript_88499:954-1649(+)
MWCRRLGWSYMSSISVPRISSSCAGVKDDASTGSITRPWSSSGAHGSMFAMLANMRSPVLMTSTNHRELLPSQNVSSAFSPSRCGYASRPWIRTTSPGWSNAGSTRAGASSGTSAGSSGAAPTGTGAGRGCCANIALKPARFRGAPPPPAAAAGLAGAILCSQSEAASSVPSPISWPPAWKCGSKATPRVLVPAISLTSSMATSANDVGMTWSALPCARKICKSPFEFTGM